MVTTRAARLAVCVALIVTVAGCVELEEIVTLRADGSGKARMTVVMDAMVAGFAGMGLSDLADEAKKAMAEGRIDSWKLIEDVRLPDGGRRVAVEFAFSDINRMGELAVAGVGYETGEASAWSTEHSFEGTVKASTIDPGGSYTLKVDFPGKVTATNGTQEGPSRVSWFFKGGTGGRLSATVSRRSFSLIDAAKELWSGIESWLDREAVAVGNRGTVEIRSGDSVLMRREQNSWVWAASGRQVALLGRDSVTVLDATGERVFTGLDVSRLEFHPDGNSILGVTTKDGDFGGLTVLDLTAGKQQALVFEKPTYDLPGFAWLDGQVVYEIPASRRGEIGLWDPATGATMPTRCRGILLAASQGELLLTGSFRGNTPLIMGPLRWCDPDTGRESRVSPRSDWRSVVDVSPSGERLALVRTDRLLVTDRGGQHLHVFNVATDLEGVSEEMSPAFVRWAGDGRRIVAGFAGWEADHPIPGPAWLIEVSTGEVTALGEAGDAALVSWPRWPGVSRKLLRGAFYLVLAVVLLLLVFLIVRLGRRLVPAVRAARPETRHATCPHCGEVIAAGARFCRHCGENIDAPPPFPGEVPRHAPRECGSCGVRLEPAVRFCPGCGETVVDDAAAEAETSNVAREPAAWICSECRTMNEDRFAFCVCCGNAQPAEPADPPDDPTNRRPSAAPSRGDLR